jgi:hypothetical protein
MSSSSQIKVDYEMLGDLESHLSNALHVLEMDIESAVTIAAATGSVHLGAKIVQFNQDWNKHRYDIKDNLEWLRDSVKNIATQLGDADKSLATSLTAPAPSGPSAH